MIRFTCLLALFLVSATLNAQNYPQDYFQSPLNIPLALSGTFGELRGNHFHSGMDIKTQGREGLNVYAAATGHIVRIKVSAYGYGNTLYMAHPNGYTTVYAHLKEFTPEVAAWVKSQQYEKQQFEVNLFPPAIFKFNKGDIIAKSGNSGGSGGPHLHFEIRDSKTEETINPALFGMPVKDTRRPYIAHVYATPVSSDAQVNGSSDQREIALTNQGNGQFTGTFSGTGYVGLVVHTFDQQDLSNNHNGIFKISQYVDDTLTYQFTIDQFAFSETRYINAHMDFARYKLNRQLAHKCYVEPGNKLSTYQSVKHRGLIALKNGKTKQVKIVVEDSWGNQSIINLSATGKSGNTLSALPENQLEWNKPNTIKLDGIRIDMASGTLYRDRQIAVTPTTACKNCFSPIYKIGENTIPAHKRYDLGIHREQLKKTDKLVWAVMDGNEAKSGLTTKWKGDWLTARPREFGSFAVMRDTIAPRLNVTNFANGKTVKKGSTIKVIATDNLSGITQYKASIDGKWVLLKHDAKRNLYWHEFEENLSTGSHVLTVVFTDEVGNTSSYQAVFTYQP
jgi:murein DD-endopeptidase MepM/ murein hydrolase activator NlpD